MWILKLGKCLATVLLVTQLWFVQGYFYSEGYARSLAVKAAQDLAIARGRVFEGAPTSFSEVILAWREDWEPVWLSLEDVFGGVNSNTFYSNRVRNYRIGFCSAGSDYTRDQCTVMASLLSSGRVQVIFRDEYFDDKWYPHTMVPPPAVRRKK